MCRPLRGQVSRLWCREKGPKSFMSLKVLEAFIPWKHMEDWKCQGLEDTNCKIVFPFSDSHCYLLFCTLRVQTEQVEIQDAAFFEASTITPWPSVFPSCICYSILYIIHNELSLVSSFGWYPLSMTLTSLSSMSSCQLADRGPKFITTFHFPPMAYLIYDSINNNPCGRMPWRPLCPSCPLPSCADYHQPFSPLKLYLLISLSGAITRFSRLMPRGKAKSDLPVAHCAISHWSQMISPWCWCQNWTESNIQTFQ